ncbi:hypothetical protein BAGA_22480 [Bacillus gaemokensis]|uniref:Uncharacterized protein n=1 Tax=Bacillus gaemokensis TaxID=574375 RepID=A0A073KIB3_9BACI|nr:hypothetical protein BAGA_22480 [Bacillus gaemokensis]KYG37772.1 hypothetical protein AZF08_21815 [Bacillus gaemokensis]
MNLFETKTFDLWAKATLIVATNTTCMYLLSKYVGLFEFNMVRSFLRTHLINLVILDLKRMMIHSLIQVNQLIFRTTIYHFNGSINLTKALLYLKRRGHLNGKHTSFLSAKV